MINKLKQMLLENPENIAALLSAYDFEKISIRNNELRFAHDSDGGANNVSIRTDQDRNSYLNVADYSHGIYTDIFSLMNIGLRQVNVDLCSEEFTNESLIKLLQNQRYIQKRF